MLALAVLANCVFVFDALATFATGNYKLAMGYLKLAHSTQDLMHLLL